MTKKQRLFTFEETEKRVDELIEQMVKEAQQIGETFNLRVTCGEDKNGLYWDIEVE